jgi:hypothetical protein
VDVLGDKSVRVRLFADVGQYQAKLAGAAQSTRKFATDANASLNKTGKQFEKLGLSANTMKLGIGAAVLVAGKSIINYANRSIEAQSALNEQMEASNVVFGDSAKAIQRFARSADENFGLSSRAALDASNSIGLFFTNVGVSDTAAASMTQSLVSLAADLASFRDVAGGTEEVLRRMQSGLAGEVEPMRRLGVDLTDVKTQAKAAALGLGGVGRELSHGEKIISRYQLILEQTSKAQGDFARTSQSLANQQRILQASQENLNASLGRAYTPVKAGFTEGLNQYLEIANAMARVGGDEDEAARRKRASGRGAAGLLINPVFGFAMQVKSYRESGKAAADATGPTSRFADAVQRYQQALIDGKGDSAEAKQALADVKRFAGQAAAEQDKLAEATMSSAEKFTLQRQAIQLVHDRLIAVPAAQRAMQSSTLDLADAHDAVADKQRELQELLQRGPIDAEALASARDRLASATEGVGDAEERLADARQRVADLERKAPMHAEELAVARERARQEIGAAERRLSTVKAAGGSPTAIAEAEVALRDARLELTQVDERAIDQERDLADAREGAIDAAKDLTKEREEERRATAEVVKASQADVEWTREVEKKKRELERAVLAVKGAEDGMVTSAWNLRDALDQQNTPLNTNVQLMSQLAQHYERIAAVAPAVAPLLGLPNIAPQEKLMLDGARAGGGPVWPGNWLVGENGPEYLQLGASGRGHVTPAPQTAQITRQSNVTSDASMSIGTVVIQDNTDRALQNLQRRRRLANLAAV